MLERVIIRRSIGNTLRLLQKPTHSSTHTHTHSLTNSPSSSPYPLAHSLTYSLSHSLTHNTLSPTHLLPHPTHPLTHILTLLTWRASTLSRRTLALLPAQLASTGLLEPLGPLGQRSAAFQRMSRSANSAFRTFARLWWRRGHTWTRMSSRWIRSSGIQIRNPRFFSGYDQS